MNRGPHRNTYNLRKVYASLLGRSYLAAFRHNNLQECPSVTPLPPIKRPHNAAASPHTISPEYVLPGRHSPCNFALRPVTVACLSSAGLTQAAPETPRGSLNTIYKYSDRSCRRHHQSDLSIGRWEGALSKRHAYPHWRPHPLSWKPRLSIPMGWEGMRLALVEVARVRRSMCVSARM